MAHSTKIDTEWDVDKYKYHYELENQWNVKRKFILAHKEKYPENRLICLAQTFCNVHFLGCRYEEPIMELINELSKGIAEKNEKWETQAFMSASSAVEERVKSRISGPNRPQQSFQQNKFINFQQSSNLDNQARKRPSDGYSEEEPKGKCAKIDPVLSKIRENMRYVVDSGPFGQVVLFESPGHEDNSVSIIHRTVTAAHMQVNYNYTNENDQTVCKLMLDGLYLATGNGNNQKTSKEAACRVAITRLKETSFTIQVKASFCGSSVDRGLGEQHDEQKSASMDVKIEDTNIGSKLMRLMGWSGGGLGKNEQGIEEPIKPYESGVKRSGLGVKTFPELRNKVRDMIRNFSNSDSKDDLVFSSDFSKEERKMIHELVTRFNLKSRSYGKDDDRHIVVFKKVKPLEIVEDLLVCGGETPKYKLIPPESMKDRFEVHFT